MATQIIMPRQGQSVESCIITKLYVKEGSEVKEGDLLFSYETDKASFDYESEKDGILLKWLFEEGDEVPVLETVCVIGKKGEKVDGAEDPGKQGEQISEITDQVSDGSRKKESHPPGPAGLSPLASPSSASLRFKEGTRVSPRARKMAEEKGIDISLIKGSGPGGRIIVRDLESAEKTEKAATTQADSVEYTDEPLTNIRKIIARSMYQSLQNSAQLTHHLGADARKLLAVREKIKAGKENKGYVNITINDLVCFAMIKALAKHPRINSQLHGETIRYFRHVNLGIAVDTDRGLMVPVVKNADSLRIEEFSKRAAALADQCRSGAADPDIIRPEAGSFTVSNLGNYGVEMFTPIINLPQTAILGVNAMVPRPADLGGGVYGFVPYIGLSLTYDHRALDGGEATRFLKEVAEEIKNIEIK
jgi:pyruvate dehydrogenase E2 component (dihydrolipoamide acetyltransferase)